MCRPSALKAKATAREKKSVRIADRLDTTQGNTPHQPQIKGKALQGRCYNCGEKGRPARECPKGKEGGKSKKKKTTVTKGKVKDGVA